ncbi:hypothetical protein CEE37_06660 [candidate division LCP-89 bacterium B3_LCP]|uniref:Uncharacterized protein n=1 Tax=candidate division LCP-89 bacterium B3_LCP TaxID=2012998 RepID=A0A532V0H6_UNCL8|nr:MAG: hypothetical protein CEE37_06660 [candidate division LCP-89 bacterium B3_LCP]
MKMKKLCCLLTVFLFAAATWAQAPNFDYGYLITNDEGYIVEGNVYDAPEFGDWDDDGDQDMMVGVFYNGNIYYYENVALPGIEPEFAPYYEITADGSPISVSYG